MAEPVIDVSLLYRVPAGRKLTNAEVDSNFNKLATAANTLAQAIGDVSDIADPTAEIQQAIADHVSSNNPHSQYMRPPVSDHKTYGIKDGIYVEVFEKLSGGSDPAFSSRSYTSTGINGTIAQEDIATTITPTANSTAVNLSLRITSTYNSDKNATVGSSTGAMQCITQVGGSGNTAKAVGILSHLNFGAGGGVHSANLCFEAGVPFIPADANITDAVGFFFPNMASVPNINRIAKVVAMANQHVNAAIYNAGVYQDQYEREVVPPAHIGLTDGMYYTTPVQYTAYATMSAGYVEMVPVYIPKRTTVTKLGIAVSGALAGAKGFISLWTSNNNGRLGTLMAQTTELDLSTAGNKEGNISVTVDGGMYWLAMIANSAVNTGIGTSTDPSWLSSQLGHTDPMASDTARRLAIYFGLGAYRALVQQDAIDAATTGNAKAYQYFNRAENRLMWFRKGV